MRARTQIVITDQDWLRLERLLTQIPRSTYSEWLQDELDRAEVVEPTAISPKVVTMNSQVVYRDENTGKELQVTLVFPNDADAASGKISVLAPVGAALLGLSEGQTIEWKTPSGDPRTLRVKSILYQPESSGKGD
jgi:regulator of nucleoside diphosphate kinase